MISWTTVNGKATCFYHHYCARRKGATTVIADKAAAWSYKASMNIRASAHRVWPAGFSLHSRKALKKIMIPIISEFLSVENFSTKECVDLMTKIRAYYRSSGIANYTYGIAQKWVNMAIKYYIILNGYNATTGTCDIASYYFAKGYSFTTPYVFDYHLFPVDTSYSKKLIGLIRVDFKMYSGGLTWHMCDDIKAFKRYWKDVDAALAPDDLPPNIYEIEHF